MKRGKVERKVMEEINEKQSNWDHLDCRRESLESFLDSHYIFICLNNNDG